MTTKLRIMIIDDEPIVGRRLKRVLEKDNFEVEVFTDGMRAVIEIENRPFDIIVTDLKMQFIDGIKILEFAKNKRPSSKVIIITGFSKKETAQEALDKGAFDFIIKPFKIAELKQVIYRAVDELKREDEEPGRL